MKIKRKTINRIFGAILIIFNIITINFFAFFELNKAEGLDKLNAVNLLGGSNAIFTNITFWLLYFLIHCFVIGGIISALNDE